MNVASRKGGDGRAARRDNDIRARTSIIRTHISKLTQINLEEWGAPSNSGVLTRSDARRVWRMTLACDH